MKRFITALLSLSFLACDQPPKTELTILEEKSKITYRIVDSYKGKGLSITSEAILRISKEGIITDQNKNTWESLDKAKKFALADVKAQAEANRSLAKEFAN